MKKLLILVVLFISFCGYSQTYKSAYSINMKIKPETEMKNRIIKITDQLITISNFSDAGTIPLNLVVNKIENNKDYEFEGKCNYYYCTTKDKDPINGYQKAIVIKKNDKLYLGLFATEIDVYTYMFNISK
jgi:hypothetical protein